MSVANVKLNVYSVERSLSFYRDLLGFKLIGKTSDDSAFLSPIGSNNKNYLLHLTRLDTGNKVIEGEQSTIEKQGYIILLSCYRQEDI